MNDQSPASQIKWRFGFLFERFEFGEPQEERSSNHGDWVVLLESPDFKIRIVKDGGAIHVEAGSHLFPSGLVAGPWYELDVVVAYLTQGRAIPDFGFGPIDTQLAQQASVLESHAQSILDVFGAEDFEEHTGGLEYWASYVEYDLFNEFDES